LSGSSSISLSERFRLIPAKRVSRNSNAMLREPRNFLYDDYMDTGMRSAQDDLGIGSSTSRTARSRAMDLELDDYVSRRQTGGYSRHEGPAYGSPSAPQVRRMASALGLPPGRSQASYDDLDYGIPRARSQRVTYRDAPRARIVRRVVEARRLVAQGGSGLPGSGSGIVGGSGTSGLPSFGLQTGLPSFHNNAVSQTQPLSPLLDEKQQYGGGMGLDRRKPWWKKIFCCIR